MGRLPLSNSHVSFHLLRESLYLPGSPSDEVVSKFLKRSEVALELAASIVLKSAAEGLDLTKLKKILGGLIDTGTGSCRTGHMTFMIDNI